jgi:protein-S-isoprenylcysteine O-methyltransferase Ste14
VKLAVQTATSIVLGLGFFGLVLFLPAGTFHYWQAWVFVAVFAVSTFVPSVYLAVRYPDALARRMKAGPTAETRPVQRVIITATFLAGIAVMVISALDWRFGWSSVPLWLVISGDVMVGVGLLGAQLVVVQNNYAGASITVEEGQPLVSTGLYGIVRHPMYAGSLIMMLGTPPALGSLWGLTAVLAAVPVLMARLLDEEKALTDDLAGYAEYTRQVRYRLIPGVW